MEGWAVCTVWPRKPQHSSKALNHFSAYTSFVKVYILAALIDCVNFASADLSTLYSDLFFCVTIFSLCADHSDTTEYGQSPRCSDFILRKTCQLTSPVNYSGVSEATKCIRQTSVYFPLLIAKVSKLL
jgi:hypothetical protein